MVSRRKADQLIVIVGPTGSGKSELAIKAAQKFDGEVISADSRTIYKGLDIGTAKPMLSERQGVVHHGFDLVEPNESFSAAEFQQKAKKWIYEIQSRGKLPIIVGGTGLYVDSILFDYNFGGLADKKLRHKLEALTIQELWDYCNRHNIVLPNNKQNKRYVIRAIEQGGINTRRSTLLRRGTFVIGLMPGKEILQQRLLRRARSLISKGFIEETTIIAKRYGWQIPGLSGNIYPIIKDIIEGKLTTTEAIERSAVKDWQLARRQLAWFKRNQAIHWEASIDQAIVAIKDYLSNS